jgi:type II secretory ATPase GspE/PulE/Tfp pilus assembly ATPase PilB-like protein
MKYLHDLEGEALEGNIGTSEKDDKKLGSTETIVRLWKAHAEGCDACNHTGYRGRIGIYEVLDNSPSIQKMIVTTKPAKISRSRPSKKAWSPCRSTAWSKPARPNYR